MASVTLSGIRKVFPNGFEAIRGVDLEIADGEFMVLVGPSGCGKSTLLRLIAGLEEASAGAILIGARDVTDEPPARRDIAMVFQSYALYPHMEVRDNLAFGLRRRRTPRQLIADKVGGVAGALGLAELLDRRPGMLSGGQRQRVAIGRAMVREPVVYLMDEPLSNLDAKLRVSMRAELARLHDRLGVTTVYVTHDQIEAMTLGDRVCVMLDGTIQQVDTPTRLFRAPVNTFVAATIGSPSMNLAVARVDGDSVVFGEHRIALPTALRAAVGTRSDVVIGLRPTDFRLRAADFALDDGAPAGTVARLQVAADVVEHLGAEQMVIFPVNVPRYVPPGTAAGPAVASTGPGPDDEDTLLAEPDRTRFTARLDMRRAVRHDEALDLWFDAEQLYLFDRETGRSLTASDPAAGPAPLGTESGVRSGSAAAGDQGTTAHALAS
jgi:multiple sugar transport system ATP-binding protein